MKRILLIQGNAILLNLSICLNVTLRVFALSLFPLSRSHPAHALWPPLEERVRPFPSLAGAHVPHVGAAFLVSQLPSSPSSWAWLAPLMCCGRERKRRTEK